MPYLSRGCKERRRSGQHHRCAFGGERRKRLGYKYLLTIGVVSLSLPLQAQSLLHIRISEGEGAVHAAGSKDSRGIAVQITDETGRPVDAAAVNFRLPEEGPGGLFAGGMRTEVVTTHADGSAAVQGIVWNRAPGAFQVRITAVKGQVRAGAIVSQYISDAPQRNVSQGARARRKWIAIAALVGAGAAAGAAVGFGRSSQPSVTPATAPPPQIGAPTITIGRP